MTELERIRKAADTRAKKADDFIDTISATLSTEFRALLRTRDRSAGGMTKLELARLTGLSVATIHSIAYGKRPVSLAILARLSLAGVVVHLELCGDTVTATFSGTIVAKEKS